MRVGLRRIDLPTHHLAVRPGQIEHAIGKPAVAIFVDQAHTVVALIGDPDHLVDLRGLPGIQGDAAADRDDRIQHRALAIGQSRTGSQGLRSRRRIAASDETRAIGFVGNLVDVGVVHRHQVKHPRRFLVVRARPAGAQD